MSPRIVVAVEASHPDPLDGIAVEIGWCNMRLGMWESFIPSHNVEHVMRSGDPTMMSRIGYRRRIAGALQDDGTRLRGLHTQLRGATVISVDPGRDAAFLTATFRRNRITPTQPWRRLVDLPSMAFGVRSLGLSDVLDIHELSKHLGLPPGNDTADGDVQAAVAVYRALRSA